MTDTHRDLLARELLDILDETLATHRGIYLDRGTSLFETLDGVDAGEVSRPSSPSAGTLAAKVAHVVVYLETLERYLETGATGETDWDEAWRTVGTVTADEWAALLSTLRTTFARVRAILAGRQSWEDERTVSSALGIAVHTAYHLGEIREAIGVLREHGPDAA